MIYLKDFATTSEYESYMGGGVILPNVSICDDQPGKVFYHKNEPDAVYLFKTDSSIYPLEADMAEFYEYDGKIEIDGEILESWKCEQPDEYVVYCLTTTRKLTDASFENKIQPVGYLLNDKSAEIKEWQYKNDLIVAATVSFPEKPIVGTLPHHDTSNLVKNGHEYVDLGLPSGALWAKHLVGADSGDTYSYKAKYFAWGETDGYSTDASGAIVDGHEFAWSTYKHVDDWDNLTKYNTKPEFGDVDNKTVLEIEDDAVRYEMGGDWHMPDNKLIAELLIYTDHEKTDIDGICGMTFTSRADTSKSLFIPFVGYRDGSDVSSVGDSVYLWSSSLYVSYPLGAVRLNAYSYGDANVDYDNRYYGYGVLGVLY